MTLRRLNNPVRPSVRRLAAVVVALCFATPAGAEHVDVDASRSTITVRVLKSGLLRAFADNHEITAPIKAGFVDDGAAAAVQIVVDAPSMQVLDPGLSPHDRDQVQRRMRGPEVLDASQFPEIRFVSMSVERVESGGWIVHGQLSLHGQTRPVTVKVTFAEGHYKGSASVKQTSFGITPITVAGGTVKVKDDVTIDFDIVTRPDPHPAQVGGPN
jgi:polyisoprenoid-binding protein YceI